MKTLHNIPLKMVVATSVLALAVGTFSVPVFHAVNPTAGAAWAEGTDGGQGKGAQGANGQQGANAEQGKGANAKGQGGPSADSEGNGPKGGASGANGGGKPAWAQEGIPEVELGRLNVARSPGTVLDRAYAEALASLSEDMASFYSMSLDDVIMALSTDFDNQVYIDSPLQNLSLLRDALDGSITLPGVTNNLLTLEAIFLGVASDKTVPISVDTVIAVTTILGMPVTGDDAAALAAAAEEVRIAVLAGHG